MNVRGRKRPPAPGLSMDDIIAGRSDPFTLPAGSPLRASTCLICKQVIGGAPVFVFAVFQFRIPAERCGAFPAASWLIHWGHPHVSDDRIAGLAIAKHQFCLEETP